MMSTRLKIQRFACLGLLTALSLAPVEADMPDSIATGPLPPIRIEYFYEAGCAVCDRMNEEILPELKSLYGGVYALYSFDTNIESNYLQLVAFQEKLGIEINEPIYLALNGRYLLSGLDEIRNRLYPLMDQLLGDQASSQRYPGFAEGYAEASAQARMPRDASSSAVEPTSTPPATGARLHERFGRFTLPGVMLAGLVDGINPCAISTFVLFVSLLLAFRIRGRSLFLAGAMFCAASFLTYLAIGFGLLHVLYRCAGWMPFRRGIDLILAGALLVLAVLSFRDAFRYHASGNPKDVQVRLPRAVSLLIRQIMNRGLPAVGWSASGGKSRHILLGGFGIGVMVTVLESICTGQVYVPTLVWIIRHGQSPSRALGYLLAYNAMFILPLIVVFLLAWRGLSTESLLTWSRRNVVFSKCMLGLFFLGLAFLFIQHFF